MKSLYLSPNSLNKENILKKLKEIQPKYKQEGLLLLGLFGSYANDTATKESDIDILYDINADIFCSKYPGFNAFKRLNEIKKELKEVFHTEIDLATADNPSQTFKKFVLEGTVYV